MNTFKNAGNLGLTDEEVEIEIERLTNSEEVRIARAEQRAKYRRRQRLYTLRTLEKRGIELIKEGKSVEDFYAGAEEVEWTE